MDMALLEARAGDPDETAVAMHRLDRITGAGLKESHVHDVMITRESPNYRTD
ncbi:MAG: hypothetical protein AAFY66_03520 [Pseudomonadota bacterium]